MGDRFICALAELDRNTQVEMARLFNILTEEGIDGRQTKGLPYHMTLGYFNVDMESELMELFGSISKDTYRFNLDFSHLGLFDLNVLFCAPDVNYQLLDLKHRICDGRTDESRGWTAHTTLLIDDEDKITRGLELISKAFTRMTGEVTSISLYEFFPVRLIGRFELK